MNDRGEFPTSGGDPEALFHKRSSADVPPQNNNSGKIAGRTPERRKRRRSLISAPVRVHSADAGSERSDEIANTVDVSRDGFLFFSERGGFVHGAVVAVTFPYSKSALAVQAEQPGRVIRVSPLVVVVDADLEIRESLKAVLTAQGYEVIALPGARQAHALLNQVLPALLIAEIEGEDLPGLDLCARIKSTPRLKDVPVVLTTRSAYPTDYASAHSLGAIVCIAKPFRPDRVGHVVRLLVPRTT